MTHQMWQIEVYGATCIGTGTCAVVAAQHFALVDARAQAVESVATPHDAIIEAADSCPVEAISVREADSGRVIAPQQ